MRSTDPGMDTLPKLRIRNAGAIGKYPARRSPLYWAICGRPPKQRAGAPKVERAA